MSDFTALEALEEAVRWLQNAKRVVALSGAGLSVDSGIPDFRSKGGLWERFDPNDYAHIDSFNENPARVWKMLDEMNDTIFAAEPNPGHLALAELERMGALQAVITQNIDGLHQEAGSRVVLEFHGTAQRLSCQSRDFACPDFKARRQEFSRPPRCPKCRRILRPDFVFFGEAIPPEVQERSFELAAQAQVMLVIGTSALVAPANWLPILTARNGGRIIEINLRPTHLVEECGALSLNGKCSDLLPRLVAALKVA